VVAEPAASATPPARVPVGALPQFDTPNILWFFGAFVAVVGSDAAISSVDSGARGLWILLVSLVFLTAFAVLAAALLRARWWVPGGVLAAAAVTFVVPAGGAFERLIGWGSDAPSVQPLQEFEGSAFTLAVVLALAGLLAFMIVRFHFILAIVAFAAFVAAQLFVPVLVSSPSDKAHATATIVIGGGMLVVGLVLDLGGARRAGFWWHLIGLVALTVGLAYHAFRHSSWGWILILVVGTAVLLLAASLRRASWGLFGVAGFAAPIVHYLDVWLGGLGLALALTAFGLALLVIGIAARLYGDTLPSSPGGRSVFRRGPLVT
jgi:hypothetical protein